MPETADWAAPLASPVSVQVDIAATATETGSIQSAIAGVAGQAIVVTSAQVVPNSLSQFAELKDYVTVFVEQVAPIVSLAYLAVSPEQPICVAAIPFGGARAAVGQGVQVACYSRPGAGSQSVVILLTYYLAR